MLPCTGRIDESLLLAAFENGADGVMVVGCLEGDCHYINGNIRARARVERVYRILEQIKIGPDRIRMFNLSAGEGERFASYANEFVGQIQAVGPSPINLVRKGGSAVITEKEST
jgi:F420-non-reducing hydrogenase iron-sulfur subunit